MTISDKTWQQLFGVSPDAFRAPANDLPLLTSDTTVTKRATESDDPKIGDLNMYERIIIDDNIVPQVEDVNAGDSQGDGPENVADVVNVGTAPDGSVIKLAVNVSKSRPMALRMPIMVHGWGYDTDGKHLLGKEYQNALVGDTPTDDFSPEGKAFIEQNKLDPERWFTGPIDLRYDSERGVWVTGTGGSLKFKEFIGV